MFRICKSIEVESGHLLSKHPGSCQFPHGHTRSVEMVYVADSLDEREMVMDFKVVKEMMESFVEQFDHALCMNTADPNYAKFREIYGDHIIPFESSDPTSEMMAQTVFRHAKQALEKAKAGAYSYPVRAEVRLERVRVWETSSSWAEYEE